MLSLAGRTAAAAVRRRSQRPSRGDLDNRPVDCVFSSIRNPLPVNPGYSAYLHKLYPLARGALDTLEQPQLSVDWLLIPLIP